MTDDAGKLVLRLSVGVLMLLHGIHKLLHGVDGIGGMLSGMGLPSFLAYGVFLGEVVGPLLVIVGLYTRLGALLMLGNMVVALALAHRAELFDIGPMGGWAIELQAVPVRLAGHPAARRRALQRRGAERPLQLAT